MKKALVLTLAFALGLGFAAFAGPLSGTWDLSISIDPGATQAGDLFVDLSTSLGIDYTVAGWVFGSSSTFDSIGWSAQSFTAAGVLGAFTFDSTMNFKPRTVTAVAVAYPTIVEVTTPLMSVIPCVVNDKDYFTYTYSAEFDDWTATGAVSIAGVSFEGLFFLEGFTGDVAAPVVAYYYDATADTLTQTNGDGNVLATAATMVAPGSGFRFTASGSAGDITITSYTYFSLWETFSTVTCGQALTKSGTYTVSGCDLGFTEEYIHVDGFSFGCATFEMGLDITCAGFQWISFKASGLDLGLGWAPLVADFQVTFGETSKTAVLCFDFTALETTCFTFGATLDYSGTAITGITIDSVTLSQEWNGISFSSSTYFNSFSSVVTDNSTQVMVFVPWLGVKDAAGLVIASIDDSTYEGYWNAVCLNTEQYKVWESFTISSEGDSCCGGGFTFDVTTSFGDKYTLKAYAFDYQFVDKDEVSGYDGALLDPTDHPAVWLYHLYDFTTAGTLSDTLIPSITGGADVNNDGMVDAIVHADTATDKATDQLKAGSSYVKATQDQLFQWVSTAVDVSYGLSSTWSLTFGLDIDVYGWNALDFGFEFTF